MIYTIELRPSGRTFQVSEDEVLLDAALARGIRMPYGCRGGMCKSCRAKVISGSADVGRAFPAPRYLLRSRQFDGYTLMCRATAASDLVIEVDEQPRLQPAAIRTAHVLETEFVTSDIAIFRLRLTASDALTFVAGQYVDLLLPDGERRSFSIANPPSATGRQDLEFHIRHVSGGAFTGKLFAGLPAGMEFSIEAPLGSFYLRESLRPAIMLASGTGYAPIRSMLLDLLPRLQKRRVILYWGARKLEDVYKFEEAENLARDYPDFAFVPVLSEMADGDGWRGRTGFVHQAVAQDFPDLSSWDVYACGTPLMVAAAQREFTANHGLGVGNFFADAFVTRADLAAAELP
jgi:CDP-4-dehydro-6-deoxyglucose reductase